MGLFRWKDCTKPNDWACCDSLWCIAALLGIIFVIIAIVNFANPHKFEDATIDQCSYLSSTYEECTISDNTPTQQLFCPNETVQVGELNTIIAGCGITSCNDRYNFNNIKQCKNHCETYENCKSFNWAPIGGDKNHQNKTVCSLYNTDISTGQFGPKQILCRMNTLECPEKTIQIGEINSNIDGCGLTDCEDRYNFSNIEHCADHCWKNVNCSSFSWARIGDENDTNTTVSVCTIYDTSEVTDTLGTDYNQILCKIEEPESECNSTAGRHYFTTKNKTCNRLYDDTGCSCDKPTVAFSGWRTCYILKCTDEDEWTFDTPPSKEKRIKTVIKFLQMGGIAIAAALLILCCWRCINWPMLNSKWDNCCHSIQTCNCSCIADICCSCCDSEKKEQTKNTQIPNWEHIQMSAGFKLRSGQIKENPWPFDPYPNLQTGVIYTIRNVLNGGYLDGGIRSDSKPTLRNANETDFLNWKLIRTNGLTHALKNISSERYLEGRHEHQKKDLSLVDRDPINDNVLQWTFWIWEINNLDQVVAIKNVSSGEFLDGRGYNKLSVSSDDPRVQTCLQWRLCVSKEISCDLISEPSEVIEEKIPSEVIEEKKHDELIIPEQIKWREWSSDDVTNWILSVLYPLGIMKYPSNLRKVLKNDGFIGEYLSYITATNLERFGFSWVDSKTLLNAIKTLIENNSNQIEILESNKSTDNEVIHCHDQDQDNWRDWTIDDVVDWIIILNDRQFAKYESDLRYAFKDEVITGKCMCDLIEYDLERYGVYDSRDRVALLDAIQLLINNNNHVYDEMNQNVLESLDVEDEMNSNVLESLDVEDSFVEEAEWRIWNANKIVNWIITLDDEFIIYYTTLRNTLSYENVIGNNLPDINQTDLERFGIASYKHQKQLLKAIKTLVNKYPNEKQYHNEGQLKMVEGYWE
eukprot:482318_1